MVDVLIDGRPLHDAESRHRGFGVFVRSLVSGLQDEPSLSVSLLVGRGADAPPGSRAVTARRLELPRVASYEHMALLGFDIRRARPSVFHSPGLEPPLWSPAPWVQTLHDVTPIVFDHPDFSRERRRWQLVFSRMRAAKAVVAISHYSAEAAITHAGLDPARVHVVPNGVDPSFAPPAHPVETDPPYILYVGVYGPHKGYDEAFRVVSALADAGYPHRLKVVGTLNPWRVDRIRTLLESIPHRDRVDLLGFVSAEGLHDLYGSASALIVTSRCEGFGLPAVEAMASGTPVVSFRNTALTEVIGDGGVLVPDGDVGAMVEELRALLDDDAQRRGLVVRGIERATAFDWKATARGYAEIYRSVASSPAGSRTA